MKRTTAPRRRASQTRSRATVQKILGVTIELIAEKGAQGVTMSEIAKRADLVIGSLYQYFTDKSAIFRAILIRHQADARTLLHHFLSEARTLEDVIAGLCDAFDAYFAILQEDRRIIGLWSITQTDPDLQALDLEDTLQNARYMTSILSPLLPRIAPQRLIATSVLLIQYSLYGGLLARELPNEIGANVAPSHKAIIRESIRALQHPSNGI